MSLGRATCRAVKAKNLLILYDAVGTLADSVGAVSAGRLVRSRPLGHG
jgi:hypothetical protein